MNTDRRTKLCPVSTAESSERSADLIHKLCIHTNGKWFLCSAFSALHEHAKHFIPHVSFTHSHTHSYTHFLLLSAFHPTPVNASGATQRAPITAGSVLVSHIFSVSISRFLYLESFYITFREVFLSLSRDGRVDKQTSFLSPEHHSATLALFVLTSPIL